jgi:hypothetical protein
MGSHMSVLLILFKRSVIRIGVCSSTGVAGILFRSSVDGVTSAPVCVLLLLKRSVIRVKVSGSNGVAGILFRSSVDGVT